MRQIPVEFVVIPPRYTWPSHSVAWKKPSCQDPKKLDSILVVECQAGHRSCEQSHEVEHLGRFTHQGANLDSAERRIESADGMPLAGDRGDSVWQGPRECRGRPRCVREPRPVATWRATASSRRRV